MERLPERYATFEEMCRVMDTMGGPTHNGMEVDGDLVTITGEAAYWNAYLRDLLDYPDWPAGPPLGHWRWDLSVRMLGGVDAVMLMGSNYQYRYLIPNAVSGLGYNASFGPGVNSSFVARDGTVYRGGTDSALYLPEEDFPAASSENGAVTASVREDGWVDISVHFGVPTISGNHYWDYLWLSPHKLPYYYDYSDVGSQLRVRHRGLFHAAPLPPGGYWPIPATTLLWLAATSPDGWDDSY